MAPGESVVSPNQLYVSPGYFEAHARAAQDGALLCRRATDESAPRVIIIDARLAKKFWPNGNAVGHRMYLPDSPDDVVKPGPKVTWLQVVGVVGSVKMKGLEEGENARVGAYYMPLAQDPPRNIGLALRARGNADPAGLTGSVQKALAEIDPELQMFDTFAMAERVEQVAEPAPRRRCCCRWPSAWSRCCWRRSASTACWRTRSASARARSASGWRSAATRAASCNSSFAKACCSWGSDSSAGWLAPSRSASAIASQLYGVGALDPMVILAVTAVLAVAALVACVGPARRAAKVNPVVALSRAIRGKMQHRSQLRVASRDSLQNL